ncbi:hypothetical protein D3C87_1176050 [compost metagenome]
MRVGMARDQHFRVLLGRGQVQRADAFFSGKLPQVLVAQQGGGLRDVDQGEDGHAQHVAALTTIRPRKNAQAERLDGLHALPGGLINGDFMRGPIILNAHLHGLAHAELSQVQRR